VPSAIGTGGIGPAAIATALIPLSHWVLDRMDRPLPRVLLLLILLLPIIITFAVVRAKLKRGQRTAEGRAMSDQVDSVPRAWQASDAAAPIGRS
jgi:hypothetical protein